MKLPLTLCALLLAAAPASPGQGSAAEQPSLLPPVPSREEVLQLPEQERLAARESIKKVLLQRTFRQKDDGARLTPENAAECLSLAESLPGIPPAFLAMLRVEAAGELYGRDLYDYRQAFSDLVSAYGVDALLMRLSVESLPYTTAELRSVVQGLPLEHVFNLVPAGELTDAMAEEQMATLKRVYTRMTELYGGIFTREQADAAADAMVELLAEYDTTLALRLRLIRKAGERYMEAFTRTVQPAAQELQKKRKLLIETDFYGSRRLAYLDYLLCN